MSATVTPTSNLQGYLGGNPGINRLTDNVQATIPSATLPLVQMHAWNTIEDFYIQSTSRRETLNWQMAPGVQELDFNPYDQTWLVAWVLSVRGLGRYRIIPPGILRDMEYPAQPRTGTALLALKPVNFSADLPETLFSQFFETVLDGVLFRFYQTPAKPWSSPQLAQYYGRRYRSGITIARDIADRGFTDGAGRWRFPYFAQGVRKN